MEDRAQSVAVACHKALGTGVTYAGSRVYAILEFDVALYPRGFQSGVPVSANVAVFLRSDMAAKPIGEKFTYNETEYTIRQIVPEESDTNAIAVLFE